MKKAVTKKTTRSKIHKSTVSFNEHVSMNTGQVRNAFWKKYNWAYSNERYHPVKGWNPAVTKEFSWFLNDLLLCGDITLDQCDQIRLCGDEYKVFA